MVENPPGMQEMWVQSVGQKDLLEKEVATPSRILAWEITWTERPGGLHSTLGLKESDTTCQLKNNSNSNIY